MDFCESELVLHARQVFAWAAFPDKESTIFVDNKDNENFDVFDLVELPWGMTSPSATISEKIYNAAKATGALHPTGWEEM